MKAIVFDIETVDVFDGIKKKPEDLEISVVGVYSYLDNSYKTYTQETLPELWDHLAQGITTLIGFNSNHFDTPLLNKYAPVDLVKEYTHIDLLEAIKRSIGRRIRLDWVAEGTLGIKKSGHGMEAVEWWKQGEYEKVKEYCLRDVKLTKELFEFAKQNSSLNYTDFGSKHTIAIDTSDWVQDERIEDMMVRLF